MEKYFDKSGKEIEYGVQYIITETNDSYTFEVGDSLRLDLSTSFDSEIPLVSFKKLGFMCNEKDFSLQEHVFSQINVEIDKKYYNELLEKRKEECQRIDEILKQKDNL